MTYTSRRRQAQAAQRRNRAQRDPQAKRTPERPCAMPKCRRLTARPLGYCDACWDKARRAES